MHCHVETNKCKKCSKDLKPEPFISQIPIPDNPYIPIRPYVPHKPNWPWDEWKA